MNNKIILNLQLACKNICDLPNLKQIESWIQKIFGLYKKKIELTIRIVDIKEMLYLNWYYAGKNYPTNVLSFSFKNPPGIQSLLLGDIVICKQIVEYESYHHKVPRHPYWAYMIIHGSLHLLGYNHIRDKDFKLMYQIEKNIMQKLGYQKYYHFLNN